MQESTLNQPEKRLLRILKKRSGRDNTGQISVRHQGGRKKRFYRKIDFKRDKLNVPAKVVSIEYDPNRTANIALLQYADGEKRYILSPMGLKVGDSVIAGESVDLKPGNALPVKNIPIGTPVHNLELIPGKGGKLIRSAGDAAVIFAKEANFVQVKLPSGEIRRVANSAMATVGQVGREEWRTIQLGKAGRARRMGKRPAVRGTAQHPASHPHGGGEGRSGIGMKSPKSPWGKRTLGKKTRKKNKYSNKFIVQRRK